jgi:SAM-dependent methyltransferase
MAAHQSSPQIYPRIGIENLKGYPLAFVEISDRLGRYDTTVEDVDLISKRFPKKCYPKVIDIACGVGRASSEFHKRGYEVLGIDLSAPQIEFANLRNPGPTYMSRDMGALPDVSFDLALSIYSSFGYCSTQDEDLALLRHWRTRIRPGGVLVMELADMDRTRLRMPAEGFVERHTNGVYQRLEMDWPNRIQTLSYAYGKLTWTGWIRIYETKTLLKALSDAGFLGTEVYGWFDGRPKREKDCLVVFAS